MSQSELFNAFLMGSVSGTVSSCLFQPLDVMKTRLQNLSKQNTRKKIGYMFVLQNVYRSDGIFGFWKGLTPGIMRCIPGVGMYFSALHFMNENIVSGKPTVVETILMGMLARTSGTVCLIPLTVLKIRFESGEYKYKGISHAIKEIREKEGFRGFTRGLGPSIMRDAPFSGIYYLFYTRIKTFVGLDDAVSKSSIKVFLSGATASALASLVTHPADVMKTYMQLHPTEFSNLFSGFAFIYQKFGIAGCFRGLLVRLIRRTLVTSMSWTVYERLESINGGDRYLNTVNSLFN